jgi:hypothetical protein
VIVADFGFEANTYFQYPEILCGFLGSLFKTCCVKCGKIEENRQSPIVPALAGKGYLGQYFFNSLQKFV